MSAPHEELLSGPAAHMTFVDSGEELLVAVARAQGLEIRRVADNQIVDVIDPERTVYAVLAVPSGNGDEQYLVAGGPDGILRAYHVGRTHSVVAERQIGPGIQDLAYARDAAGEELIAIMHRDGISLWHRQRQELTVIAHPAEAGRATGFKLCLYRAFDTLWLAGAYSDDSLIVWRLDGSTPQLVARLPQIHRGQVWTLVNVDGPTSEYAVASGSADGTARLWRADLTNGLVQGRILQAGSTVRRLGAVTDSELPLLVTATAAGGAALWRFDGETDRPMREITRHLGEAWSLACAATVDGGIVIASGDMHGVVQVSKLRTDVISDRTAVDAYQAQGTAWAATSGGLADGTYVAVAGVDQMVHALDPAAEAPVPVDMHGHVSTVRSLASAGNALDPHVISGGADRRVLDWDPVTGELRREIPMGHQGEVWALATFVLRGAQYVASGSADGTVRVSRLAPDATPRTLIADLGAVNALVASPDGDDTLLTIASTRGVRIISARHESVLAQISNAPVAAACGVFDGSRHLVVTARPDGDTCILDVIDVHARSITSTFRYTHSSTQVSALAAGRLGEDVLVFGGCEDGRILVWQIDGTLVGHPAHCGTSTVRSMGIVDVGFAALTSGPTVTVPSLYAADDDGRVKLFPIAAGSLLRSGGSIGTGVAPAAILLQDQPTGLDTLSRNELVETINDVLMSPGTEPPVVIGVHAPWGQGKSSVLRQLRRRLDPSRADVSGSELRAEAPPATHQLVPIGPPPSALRRWRQGGEVRTRLTRAWAWRQVQKPRATGGTAKSLGYEMRPKPGQEKNAITVWFNPWMYETPEQVWAGLTREILTSITERLPPAERERLWFDLNLRRTDPSAMRKRILLSYIPRSLLGMVIALLAAVVAVVAVSAMAVTAVQTLNLAALIGSSAVIILTVLGFIGNLTLSSFQQVRGWLAPGVLTRPTGQGVTSSSRDDGTEWKSVRDPMESGQRGYLYMLQHDVGEVLELASAGSPIVILVDDLDRCGPHIVSDTIEAVNLFLNKAFGPCHFVIALDPSTVAAQLETVYDSIRARASDDPSSFGHLQHTGWRFMEKILDLPIRLPRVRDAAIATYLDELLDATGPAAPTPAPTRTRVSVPPAASVSGGGVNIDTSTEEVTVAGPEDQGVQLAEYLESLAPVRRALRTAVLALPARNPRQTKAFVNLWRFYMVLDYRTGFLSSSLTAIEKHSIEMARFVEVMVRWPWLLDALGAHRGEEAATRRIILAELLDACSDTDRWRSSVLTAGLDPDDPATVGLRNLFCRPDTDAEVFASIAVRYL